MCPLLAQKQSIPQNCTGDVSFESKHALCLWCIYCIQWMINDLIFPVRVNLLLFMESKCSERKNKILQKSNYEARKFWQNLLMVIDSLVHWCLLLSFGACSQYPTSTLLYCIWQGKPEHSRCPFWHFHVLNPRESGVMVGGDWKLLVQTAIEHERDSICMP